MNLKADVLDGHIVSALFTLFAFVVPFRFVLEEREYRYIIGDFVRGGGEAHDDAAADYLRAELTDEIHGFKQCIAGTCNIIDDDTRVNFTLIVKV